MSKKFDKLKDGFLQDLSKVTDDKMDQIKQTIGIKNNKPANTKPSMFKQSWFKHNRKPLIWGLSLVLGCLIIIISIVSVTNYRNTPVYKEMTATNVTTNVRLNHQVRKAPNNFEDDLLEQIGIIETPGIACYAKPEEEIVITIKIDNPKSYEILSFTLNGYKYQTFEFVDGSNSNQISVKFVTTTTSGIQKVTIDAIKYVDGDKIKDARFGGNKTIQIGVTYQNIPTATIEKTINLNNCAITTNVIDIDNLMDKETGSMLYLFDEENLSKYYQLDINDQTAIYIPNLKFGNKYTLILIGVYNLLDGEGKRGVVLAKDTFTTVEGYQYGQNLTTYDTTTINLIKTKGFNGNLKKAEIFDNENLIQTITLENDNQEIIFTNLLSNKEYKVVTTYEYELNKTTIQKEIETTIKTQERPIPTVEITNPEPTKDGLNFDYQITDTTDVGKIIKVEVYKVNNTEEETTETLVENQTFTTNIKTITNLLSNNDYKIYVTYEYDLLDGEDKKTIVINYSFKTLEKELPVITFKDIKEGKKEVSFNYEITDNDQVSKITSVDLLKENDIIKTITDLTNLTFTDIYANNDYTLRINYEYDLNDETGSHTSYVLEEVHTLALDTPYAIITNAVGLGTSITGSFSVIDNENIIKGLKAELYKKEETNLTLVQTIENLIDSDGKIEDELVFTNLQSGTYVIVLVYEYDLSDGLGVQKVDAQNQPADPNMTSTYKLELIKFGF